MASVAQIQANRINAQKSTGPRTAEGKERACRNALKHGLLAREAVIQGEDPAEFEVYREGMLAELAPAGMVETMLAERVVGLAWRLRRAEPLQNMAFAALDEGEPEPLLEARHEEWKQLKGSEWDRGVAGVIDEDAALGQVVVEDFAGARVLDRLLMYERRIESSLYRTMTQLRREREARAAAAEPEGVSHSEGRLPAGQQPSTPAQLGSFGAEVALGSPPGKTALAGPEPLPPVDRGTRGQDVRDTFSDTFSGWALPGVRGHGQDAHATKTPDGPGSSPGQAPPAKAGVTANVETADGVATNAIEGASCETNPILGGGDALRARG